jgi:hypothetical protein
VALQARAEFLKAETRAFDGLDRDCGQLWAGAGYQVSQGPVMDWALISLPRNRPFLNKVWQDPVFDFSLFITSTLADTLFIVVTNPGRT